MSKTTNALVLSAFVTREQAEQEAREGYDDGYDDGVERMCGEKAMQHMRLMRVFEGMLRGAPPVSAYTTMCRAIEQAVEATIPATMPNYDVVVLDIIQLVRRAMEAGRSETDHVAVTLAMLEVIEEETP